MVSKPSSGRSSPLSSTTTVTSPPSPVPHIRAEQFNSPLTQASHIVEFIASRSTASSSVYVYDVAEQVGFGTLTKEWAQIHPGSATAIDLQTRAGAGFALVGRLSQGTSFDAVKGTILTAYTTPSGLATMAPSFAYLPTASPTSRLIIQTPMVTPVGDTLSLSPTLASIASAWSLFPENITVLLSSTPQQSVDFAVLSYRLTTSHVIHLFDHHSTSRETGHFISPISKSLGGDAVTVYDAVRQAGYSFFEYHGDKEATTAIIILNGSLAASLKAAVNGHPVVGLGVVIINVLRPWDEIAIQSVVPSSVTKVHVFDDVPNRVTQGALYVDVFSALWSIKISRSIHEHRIIPADTQKYINEKDAFLHFVQKITDVDIQPLPGAGTKKLLLFSTPQSPFSALPNFLQRLFLTDTRISSRLLTDHDVFSKSGGIMTSRLLISRHTHSKNAVPIPIELPLNPNSLGHADLLAILDQSLLKTHSLLEYAKPGSVVLVSTPWSSAEFTSNLPRGIASLILVRDLHVYLIDAKGIAESVLERPGPHEDAFENLLLAFAFLKLYIGPSVTQAQVLQIICKDSDHTVQEFPLGQAVARVWSSLVPVQIPVPDDVSCDESPSLKTYEFNAIAVETESQTVVNGARLSSWHEAAKHLIFPAVYAPPQEQIGELPGLCNPALRPEVPETTFLVTCTVNKRLTPLEYDRNVFHLEFDTSNTGLKYAIGEALGIHGWNDEQEVYDFCDWYGIDPNRLITIPVGPDESKVHTRTIFQALQQQIDLYGRPPKSFYTDLAEYATADVDRYGLRFIGSPEGSSTFKKLSEKDTVSFADVLQKFPSARPGIERLCELIGDIKPRHYSIASAQSVVGDRVDLLVVTVDWLTPSGQFLVELRSRC
jgi:sulfite reductase (NADPH) flavoprotein alpha-component